MARTPRQRALQNWLLTELVQQLGGAQRAAVGRSAARTARRPPARSGEPAPPARHRPAPRRRGRCRGRPAAPTPSTPRRPTRSSPGRRSAINVVGAFVLGVLPALAVVRRSRSVALALGPGVLGGFTTVSAWAGQVRELADDGHVGLAGALPRRSRWPPASPPPRSAGASPTAPSPTASPRMTALLVALGAAVGRAAALRRRPRPRRPVADRHAAGQRPRARACSGCSPRCRWATRAGRCSAPASAAASRRSRPSRCRPSSGRRAPRRRTSWRRPCCPSAPALRLLVARGLGSGIGALDAVVLSPSRARGGARRRGRSGGRPRARR